MPANTFDLPDLGEGLTEAEVLHWLVAEGDEVVTDQPVVEVETAKSVVEIPSPYAGTVRRLHGAEGETLTVGSPLITIGDADAADARPESSASAGPQGAASYREEEAAGSVPTTDEGEDSEGSGNVLIGYGTSAASGRRRRRKSARTGASADSGPAAETKDALAGTTRMAPIVISPLVRRLAREHGVELAEVEGTGPGGLILRKDVQAAIARVADQRERADAAGPAPTTLGAVGGQSRAEGAPTAAPLGPVATDGGERDARSGLGVAERTPVKGVRKAIAEAMTRSRTEIPEATVWVDVDATELLGLRAALKAKDPEGAPSLLALIGRFVLAGLKKYPAMASRIVETGDGQEILRFDGVNLGIAVDSERGLLVPAVRDAHLLTAAELGERMRETIERARAGKASPADLQASTFTLNNYGVFGTDGSTPIINHPEVGILGIGRIIDRPWVVDGELAVRKVTTLTIAFDHRVCDGGTAGGFLRFVADCVEDPRAAIAAL